jgi:hypothetical protein
MLEIKFNSNICVKVSMNQTTYYLFEANKNLKKSQTKVKEKVKREGKLLIILQNYITKINII